MSGKRKNQFITREQLLYYVYMERTVPEISILENMNPKVLRKYLNDYEIEEYYECRFCHTNDKDELKSQIQWKHYNICNICDDCCNNLNSKAKINPLLLTNNYLYNEYVLKDRSIFDIKSELKCKEHSLLKYIKLYKFEEKYKCRICGSTEHLIPTIADNDSTLQFKYQSRCSKCVSIILKNTLENQYLKKLEEMNITIDKIKELNYSGKSLFSIAKEYKISYNFLKAQFKKNNIEEYICCQLCGTTENLQVAVSKNKKVIIKAVCRDCHYDRLNKGYAAYSKSSQELFWAIYNKLPEELKQCCHFAELNKEHREKLDSVSKEILHLDNVTFLYDFYLNFLDFKFIIEYNGDIFHANPKIYKEDDHPNPFNKEITAKEIWEKDQKRDDYVFGNNGHLLIIWDSDYKEDKDFWINYSLSSIRNVYNSVYQYKKEIDI